MKPTASTSSLFFFNDTATTEIYTLSLHDALPISILTVVITMLLPVTASAQFYTITRETEINPASARKTAVDAVHRQETEVGDRKSTRLNSSHANISYAVFCLKKK